MKDLESKLGLVGGVTGYTLYAPSGYSIPAKSVDHLSDLPNYCEWIQVFFEDMEDMYDQLGDFVEKLSQSGVLWVSWPKKSSGVKSDLTDSVVRHYGLKLGLVDVKVASIDATWSGLKFVYRSSDR